MMVHQIGSDHLVDGSIHHTQSWMDNTTGARILEVDDASGSPLLIQGWLARADGQVGTWQVDYTTKTYRTWAMQAPAMAQALSLTPSVVEQFQAQRNSVPTETIDGSTTRKLTLAEPDGGSVTLWIDEATLLPVKTRFLPAKGQTVESTVTLQWLPRTSANIARLQQVAPPAGFTVLNAAPPNLAPVPGAR